MTLTEVNTILTALENYKDKLEMANDISDESKKEYLVTQKLLKLYQDKKILIHENREKTLYRMEMENWPVIFYAYANNDDEAIAKVHNCSVYDLEFDNSEETTISLDCEMIEDNQINDIDYKLICYMEEWDGTEEYNDNSLKEEIQKSIDEGFAIPKIKYSPQLKSNKILI